MSNHETYKDDPLRKYIRPDSSEKAPKGFTSNIMTRIRLEAIPVETTRRNQVPLISSLVTVILIITAFLIPADKGDSFLSPVLKIFRNAKISLPQISISELLKFSFPTVIIYAFIGIIILTVFDRALKGVFRK